MAGYFCSYPNELLSPFCLNALHDCVTAEMDNKVAMQLTFSVSLKARDARLSSSCISGFDKATLEALAIIYDQDILRCHLNLQLLNDISVSDYSLQNIGFAIFALKSFYYLFLGKMGQFRNLLAWF